MYLDWSAAENGIDLPFIGGYIIDALAVEKHISGCGVQETANDPQCGSFAAAGGTQQREKFFVIKIEVDTIKYPFSVELHNKILESDQLFGHYPPPFLFEKCVDFMTSIHIL